MSSRDKKILIVTHHFPPYHNVVGGMVRIVKLAAFLQGRGWDVHVLASAGRHQGFFCYEDIVANLNVYYVGKPTAARTEGNSQAKPSADTRGRRLELFAKSVARDLLVPDTSVISVPKYYRAALDIVRQNDINNMLVSSPPHSTQLVGVLLKRKLGEKLNLIVDYRDSWNCGKSIYSKTNPVSNALNLRFEKEVLRRADHFLYVSDPMVQKINRRFFDMTEKSTLVMNGFDARMQISTGPGYERGDALTLAHFGAINVYQRVYRDPTPLFEAIVKSKLPIKVALYGHVDCADQWRQKMGSALELRGNLPHDAAVAEMTRADVLLFLHTMREASDEIVSGKVFDYILARRPILVVGPPQMEVVRIVEENNLGYCLDVFDPVRLLAGLERIYDVWANRGLPDVSTKDISAFSRDRQYEKVLDLLK